MFHDMYVRQCIEDIERLTFGIRAENKVVFVAYLFYKLLTSGDSGLESAYSVEETAKVQLNRFLSGEIKLSPELFSALTPNIQKAFLEAYRFFDEKGDITNVYRDIVMDYDQYQFRNAHGNDSTDNATPYPIIYLAKNILGLEKANSGDGLRVADVCCGNGDFLTSCAQSAPGVEYFGYEIDADCAAIVEMKKDILGVDLHVELGDIQQTFAGSDAKFDRIFSNYPPKPGLRDYEQVLSTSPFWFGRKASEWYFNYLVASHLEDDGKAVVVSSINSAWDAAGHDARQYFIQNGLLEAVIYLYPGNEYSISTREVLYVFSKNNSSTRIIEAEDLDGYRRYERKATNGSGEKEASDLNRSWADASRRDWKDVLLDRLTNDADMVVTITPEEAAAHDFSLSFREYCMVLPEYRNGTPLGEVAEIIRGTTNSKDVNERMQGSDFGHRNQYLLQISDLDYGTIKRKLSNPKAVDLSFVAEEQRLRPYDIIITRSAQPVKVAIVSPDERRALYPNGNMYIIRMKGQKVNPYFLLAFLLSREGQAALDAATTDGALKTLSWSALSRLIFPLDSVKKQRRVAKNVAAAIKRSENFVAKLTGAKIDIENAYWGGGDDSER